jgi:hypothetical protein
MVAVALQWSAGDDDDSDDKDAEAFRLNNLNCLG